MRYTEIYVDVKTQTKTKKTDPDFSAAPGIDPAAVAVSEQGERGTVFSHLSGFFAIFRFGDP